MDKSDLRAENLRLLKEKLQAAGEATKPQLAAMTGLSTVTVGDIIKSMLVTKEIEECRLAPSTGGRPPRLYRLCEPPDLALACYAYNEGSRTEITAYVLNMKKEIIESKGMSANTVTAENLATLVAPLIEAYPLIKTAVVGLPHTVPPLAAPLSDILRRPVHEVSDIQAATLGCMNLIKNPAGVIVGLRQLRSAPSAAGIIGGGKIYQGQGGMAGRMMRQGKLQWERNPVLKAAELALTVIGLLNPHGIVIYDDRLKPDDLAAVEYRLTVDIPAPYMPQIILRSEWQEDYSQGVYNLTAQYLREAADSAPSEKS